MAPAQLALGVHGVGDGVPALQADDGQRVDGQLAGEHRQEAGHAAARPRLPVGGVVVVLVAGVVVHPGDEHQVQPHAQVSYSQVAHQEPGDGYFVVADEQDDQHGQVPRHRQNRDDPGEAAQHWEAQQVLTRVEGVRRGRALDKGAVEAAQRQVCVLEVDVV